MALEYLHGYNDIATADLTVGPTPAFSTISSATVQGTTKRHGNHALGFSSAAGYAFKTGLSSASTRILGFAFRVDSLASQNGHCFATMGIGSPIYVGGSEQVHVSLCLTSTGALQVYNGRPLSHTNASGTGTSLGSASSQTLSAGQWYYIEIVATFHASTGSVEVWVDGVRWLNITGADTVDGSTATADTIAFAATATASTYYDDVYSVSGTGGIRTTRLGPIKVLTNIVETGAGANDDFTRSTGADTGALLDDATPDGNSTYVESTSIGNKVTNTLPAYTASGQVLAVQVRLQVQKTDVAAREATPLLRVNGTDYQGTQTPLTTTYGELVHIFEESPDTSNDFTDSEISGAEAGLEDAA